MNRNRLIFYAIFAAFHLGAFIFTIIIENNTGALFSMVKYIPWFKYGTLLGLILVIADVIWSWSINKNFQKERAASAHENNMLKAKLFDMQESGREAKTPPTNKN